MSENFRSIKNFVQACEGNELNAKEVCNWALANNIPFVWHPLGFVMATLMSEGKEKIRLHLWPTQFQKVQKPTWLIHDHFFDLVSWVLCGEIKNIEYKKSNLEATHELYSVTYDSNGSILTKLDLGISLNIQSEEIIQESGSYAIKSGILHQSISNSENTTVTVCHTIDVRGESPLVVGKLNGGFRYHYKRSKVERIDLLKIVEEI